MGELITNMYSQIERLTNEKCALMSRVASLEYELEKERTPTIRNFRTVAQIAALRELSIQLAEALTALYRTQNGPPRLYKADDWYKANRLTEDALKAFKESEADNANHD